MSMTITFIIRVIFDVVQKKTKEKKKKDEEEQNVRIKSQQFYAQI